MNNIIYSLFEEYGLVSVDINPGKLFHFSQDGIYSYWLVIEVEDISEIISKQSEYYSLAKDLLRDEWFDKNAYLLVLYKVDVIDAVDKSSIIAIEENPYMFKKHVLTYTSDEEQKLVEALRQSARPIGKFIQQKVLSNQLFEHYKNNMNSDDHGSLMYRIMHKIPFINVEAKQEIGLTALNETNNQKVATAGYQVLDDIIRLNYFGMTTTETESLSADEIYDVLINVLEP